MTGIDRRELLKTAVFGATALTGTTVVSGEEAEPVGSARPWEVVDVNLHLFQWPFRRLALDDTDKLAAKLHSLHVQQAWAGSYEGLFHRDLAGVNQRLAEACGRRGGLLVPFGSVNPTLLAWEEDLRRCHEQFRMPGVRLHPNYHGYTLDDLRFGKLLAMAAERRMLVQIAASLEDARTQHPSVRVPDVDLSPLPDWMNKLPQVQVVLLNLRPRGGMESLARTPQLFFDIARVEGTDGIANLIDKVGMHRVLFGTHAPFLVYEAALIRVYEGRLTELQVQALLGRNAAKLLSRQPV